MKTEDKIKKSMEIENFRIRTLFDLERAVRQKRSVVFNMPIVNQKPMPAAVFINMNGKCILARLKHGTYIYRK